MVDEVYAGSVHVEHRPFVSVLDVLQECSAEEQSAAAKWLHVLWGASKDFGLSGVRLGVLFTASPALLQAMQRTAVHTAASSLTQRAFACILRDDKFIQHFLHESRARLRTQYRVMCAFLDQHGIRYLGASGGFVLWVDLTPYMSAMDPLTASPSTHTENKAPADIRLWEHLVDKGVFVYPGRLFGAQQLGWFRVCYCFETRLLLEGLTRLVQGLGLETARSKL
jgi:aspartate/methionine/tyrosine aminotransferase